MRLEATEEEDRVWRFRELLQSSGDLSRLLTQGVPWAGICERLRRWCMRINDTPADVNNLRAQLRNLDAEFDREMRARGFDPLQAENVALPSQLAKLYAEREMIKAQLEELEGQAND